MTFLVEYDRKRWRRRTFDKRELAYIGMVFLQKLIAAVLRSNVGWAQTMYETIELHQHWRYLSTVDTEKRKTLMVPCKTVAIEGSLWMKENYLVDEIEPASSATLSEQQKTITRMLKKEGFCVLQLHIDLRNSVKEHDREAMEDFVDGGSTLADPLHKVWRDQIVSHAGSGLLGLNDMKDTMKRLKATINPRTSVHFLGSAAQFVPIVQSSDFRKSEEGCGTMKIYESYVSESRKQKSRASVKIGDRKFILLRHSFRERQQASTKFKACSVYHRAGEMAVHY